MITALLRWVEAHLRALLFGLGELVRSPLASITTLAVIGIAMVFPAGLYALLQNVQQLTKDWKHDPTISLYLKPQVSNAEALALTQQLRERPDIIRADYISPEQGLEEFQQQSELKSAFQILPSNPLPGVIMVAPRIQVISALELQELLASLSRLPNVEASELDTLWIKRLYELMTLGKHIAYGLMLLFGAGVVLIVGNTLRITTQSHRHEVLVLRLIGATPAFIRRPMLYRGALYGMLGGLIAWSLVAILFFWLRPSVQRLADTYHSHWQLLSLTNSAGIIIVAICAGLGLIGSWIAVQHYLSTPEEI